MKYICTICGYIYDEAKEKTPFAALADDWKCPVCKAAKTDFKAEESPAQDEKATAATAAPDDAFAEALSESDAILGAAALSDNPALDVIQIVAAMKAEKDTDHTQLSVGQLAALCSNLARGCEKQYKEEEAALFRELAAYFTRNVPAAPDATVDALTKAMQADIDGYEEVRKAADAAGDRGAARICVWGEKVTRMLSSLVTRYLKEGESLLAGTEIWVCTACGFVYIGDTLPEQCPVCKVPAWKFEKIERRAAQ